MIDFTIKANDRASKALSSIAKTADRLSNQFEETSRDADDVSQSFEDLSASTVPLSASLENVQHDLDEVGDESQDAVANLAAVQSQMITASGTATTLDAALSDISVGEVKGIDNIDDRLQDAFSDTTLRPELAADMFKYQDEEDMSVDDISQRVSVMANIDEDETRSRIAKAITGVDTRDKDTTTIPDLVASPLFNEDKRKSFIGQLRDQLDIDPSETKGPPQLAGAISNFVRSTDTNTFDDLARQISQRSSIDANYDEVLDSITDIVAGSDELSENLYTSQIVTEQLSDELSDIPDTLDEIFDDDRDALFDDIDTDIEIGDVDRNDVDSDLSPIPLTTSGALEDILPDLDDNVDLLEDTDIDLNLADLVRLNVTPSDIIDNPSVYAEGINRESVLTAPISGDEDDGTTTRKNLLQFLSNFKLRNFVDEDAIDTQLKQHARKGIKLRTAIDDDVIDTQIKEQAKKAIKLRNSIDDKSVNVDIESNNVDDTRRSIRDLLGSVTIVNDKLGELNERLSPPDSSEIIEGDLAETIRENANIEDVSEDDLRAIPADDLLEFNEFNETLKDELDLSDEEYEVIVSNIRESPADSTLFNVEDQIRSEDMKFNSDIDLDVDSDERKIATMNAALAAADNRVERTNDSVSRLSRGLKGLSANLGVSSSLVTTFAVAMRGGKEAVDDMDDEISDVDQAIGSLTPSFSSLSANIGPFNVALSNVAITLPSILAIVGPLVATLGGLAGALAAASAALGAFLAVGALDYLEQLEQQFAGITGKGEALEALGKGFARALQDAIEPLRNVEFDGMSGTELFISVLQDIIYFVGITAEVLAELLEMPEVASFFNSVGGALLGTSDAAKSSMSMLDGLQSVIEDALPIVEDLLVFFIVSLPAALEFFGEVTKQLETPLEDVSMSLLQLTESLIRLGTAVLQNVLPVLATLLNVLTMLVDGILLLGNALGPVTEGLFTFLVVTLFAVSALVKLNAAIFKYSDLLEVFIADSKNADAVLRSLSLSLFKLFGALMLVIGGLLLIEKGLNMLGASLSDLEPIFTALVDGFNGATSAIDDFGTTVEDTVPGGEYLLAILNVLVALSLIFAGALMVLVGSVYLATAAQSAYGIATTQAALAQKKFMSMVSATTLRGLIIGLYKTAAAYAREAQAATTAAIANSRFATSVYGVIGALGILLGGLGIIAYAFVELEGIVSMLTIALVGLAGVLLVVAVLVFTMLSPIYLAVGAILAIVAAVALLIKHFDGLLSAIQDIIKASVGLSVLFGVAALDAALTSIIGLLNFILNPIGTASKWWDDLAAAMDDVLSDMRGIKNTVEQIMGITDQSNNGDGTDFMDLFSPISGPTGELTEEFTRILGDGVDSVTGGVIGGLSSNTNNLGVAGAMPASVSGSLFGPMSANTDPVPVSDNTTTENTVNTNNTDISVKVNTNSGSMSEREKYKLGKIIDKKIRRRNNRTNNK